jgi:hypothetical protein
VNTVRWASVCTLLLIACFPREPCACAATAATPLTMLVVHGAVTRNNVPVRDAVVQAEAFFSASCASTRDVFRSNDFAGRSDTSGNYTLRLVSALAPRSRCLRLVVRPTSFIAADSVVIGGVLGNFTARHPDTLNLNLEIP